MHHHLRSTGLSELASDTLSETLPWLNKVFDIHRDEKAIEWVRNQADGYDASLKVASDSLMQENIKTTAEKQGSK